MNPRKIVYERQEYAIHTPNCYAELCKRIDTAQIISGVQLTVNEYKDRLQICRDAFVQARGIDPD